MSEMTPLPTVLAHISGMPTIQQMQALQSEMVGMDGADRFGPEPEHFFADGVYGRKLVIPAGRLLFGRWQRKANITVQLYGDCEIATEDGPKRIVGTHVFRVPPMTKRLMFTHAETAWITCHATDETDMALVERDLIVPEPGIPAMYSEEIEGESK